MNTRGELKRQELIGLDVVVISATHPGYIGIAGRVVDETKHMLVIEMKGIEKRIPKRTCVFEFVIGGRKEKIDGREIEFRPEDRIKRIK